MEESASQADAGESLSRLLTTAQNSIRDDLEQQLQGSFSSLSLVVQVLQRAVELNHQQPITEKETRLTGLLNVMGFETLDDLEQFVYLHGCVDVVPSTSRNRIESQTQLNLSPRKKEARNQKRKEELVKVKDELSLVKVEFEYAKGVHKEDKTKLERLERDYAKTLGDLKEMRDLNAAYVTRLARSSEHPAPPPRDYVMQYEAEMRRKEDQLEKAMNDLRGVRVRLSREENARKQAEFARKEAELKIKEAELATKEALLATERMVVKETQEKEEIRVKLEKEKAQEREIRTTLEKEIAMLRSRATPRLPGSTSKTSTPRVLPNYSTPNLQKTIYRDAPNQLRPRQPLLLGSPFPSTSATSPKLAPPPGTCLPFPSISDRLRGTPSASTPTSVDDFREGPGLSAQHVKALDSYNEVKSWILKNEKWIAAHADPYIARYPSFFSNLPPRPRPPLPEEMPDFPPREMVQASEPGQCRIVINQEHFLQSKAKLMKAYRDAFWDFHRAHKAAQAADSTVQHGQDSIPWSTGKAPSIAGNQEARAEGTGTPTHSLNRPISPQTLNAPNTTRRPPPASHRPSSPQAPPATNPESSSHLFALTSQSPRKNSATERTGEVGILETTTGPNVPFSAGRPRPTPTQEEASSSTHFSEPETEEEPDEPESSPHFTFRQTTTTNLTSGPRFSPTRRLPSPRKNSSPRSRSRSGSRSPRKNSTTTTTNNNEFLPPLPRGPEPRDLFSPRRTSTTSNSVRQNSMPISPSKTSPAFRATLPRPLPSPPSQNSRRVPSASPEFRQPSPAQPRSDTVEVKEEPDLDEPCRNELAAFQVSPARELDEAKRARREKRKRKQEKEKERDESRKAKSREKKKKEEELGESDDEEEKRAKQEKRRRRRERERAAAEVEAVQEEEEEEEEEPPKKKKKKSSKSRDSPDEGDENRGVDLSHSKKRNHQDKESDVSSRKIEINPARNKGQSTHFAGVERKKDARQQMVADTCDCCTEYYKRAHPETGAKDKKKNHFLEDRHVKQQAHLQSVSRHRAHHRVEPDPPDYWQLGFPTTQKVVEINERAALQKADRRAYQEAEASKADGFYQFARKT